MTAPEPRDAQSGVEEVLAEHVRGDWSDRTYTCQGCANRFEDVAPEKWAAMSDAERRAHRSEYSHIGHPGWSLADYNAHVAAALGPLLAAERAKAWDEGYAQAEKDFVHSDYCGTRCQCDPNLTSGAGNPYRADREQDARATETGLGATNSPKPASGTSGPLTGRQSGDLEEGE